MTQDFGLFVDVILTPSDIQRFEKYDNRKTGLSVVFDILRATSTIVAALNNGAAAVIPTETIEEALGLKKIYPQALLAGERNGLKIPASMTGGIEFDSGNSPREFVREKVENRVIITTTTNGTRAIKSAMQNSRIVLISSFLNITATARYVEKQIYENKPLNIVLICSGTREEPALEDIIAAGFFIDKINHLAPALSDAAIVAKDFYLFNRENLSDVVKLSSNAKRLLNHPDLADDVDFCLQIDLFNGVVLAKNGKAFLNKTSS